MITYRIGQGPWASAVRSLLEGVQGVQCAICSRATTRLAIDHDHETGAVRGLLCIRCNTKLERLAGSDWPEALAYLAEPPARGLRLDLGADGRPAATSGRFTHRSGSVSVTVRLKTTHRDQLDVIAGASDRDRSELIREASDEFFAQRDRDCVRVHRGPIVSGACGHCGKETG